ncbi:hypothetical protein [Micromonospora globbae]|uniref:hypothetical protein n=1 Tax=Micromonospora globbae TaxID=1894969 RepID=UPI003445B963
MSLLRRAVPPPAEPDPAGGHQAELTGRINQAVQLVDARLAAGHRDRQQLVDALLDVRNVLRPPERRS